MNIMSLLLLLMIELLCPSCDRSANFCIIVIANDQLLYYRYAHIFGSIEVALKGSYLV